MRDEGIDVLLQSQPVGVSGRSGDAVKVRVRQGNSERTMEASDILVAAGRTPNTDSIGLAKAGVELDERLYSCQRATADHRPGCLGRGRLCRQPSIHSCG